MSLHQVPSRPKYNQLTKQSLFVGASGSWGGGEDLVYNKENYRNLWKATKEEGQQQNINKEPGGGRQK